MFYMYWDVFTYLQESRVAESERPVSVDKKMVEQLEEFGKKLDGKPGLPAAPPIRYWFMV